VAALYAKLEDEFGAVDVLINNASLGKPAVGIKDVGMQDFMENFVSFCLLTS